MLLRFFTLGSSLALYLASATCAALAQSPGPSRSATPSIGYIRFWDMLPSANGGFILRKEGGSASASAMAISAKSFRYSGYIEFPAGHMRVSVYKDKEPNTPLRTFDIDLKPATFFTVLVGPQASGAGGVQLIDDTVLSDSAPGALTIRNCFPGLTISVRSNNQRIADALSYGQSYSTKGMGSALVPITLATRLPNGTPAESGLEADFRHMRRATILVIPDTYGRFRPRLVPDGVLEVGDE